jgi:transposase
MVRTLLAERSREKQSVAEQAQHAEELRVRRRHLANFENLPVATRVYELSAEQRAFSCCDQTRHELGADESWQVEYLPGHFERIHHVRKKCAACERKGEHPRMEVAAKPAAAIDKGMAAPGLLACIVTSKFAEYLPPYRCTAWRTFFSAKGLRFPGHAIGPVWRCSRSGRAPLRTDGGSCAGSHLVATDDTVIHMHSAVKAANAWMRVYVGDDAHVFHFTPDRGHSSQTRRCKSPAFGSPWKSFAPTYVTVDPCRAHHSCASADKPRASIPDRYVAQRGQGYAWSSPRQLR